MTTAARPVAKSTCSSAPGHKLVRLGMRSQRGAGRPGLLGHAQAAATAVAQAPEHQGGQLRGVHAVAHRVSDRQMQGVTVQGVVEGVPAGDVRRHQLAGQS